MINAIDNIIDDYFFGTSFLAVLFLGVFILVGVLAVQWLIKLPATIKMRAYRREVRNCLDKAEYDNRYNASREIVKIKRKFGIELSPELLPISWTGSGVI